MTVANLIHSFIYRSITGNTFIPLYCMGVPDPPSGVETENCFALAEVEEGGAPITMTLE